MKKIIVLLLALICNISYAQTVSGDIGYYTKSLDLNTGVVISEEPAMVSHLNVGVEYKKISFSAAYSGHHGVQNFQDGDHFHMIDLFLSYKVNKLSVNAGYELNYTDNKDSKNEIGHGLFAMATWSKNKMFYSFIFFSDPRFMDTYYIGSLDFQVGKNVSVYSLGGYTNTKSTRWYGLVGLKFNNGHFFIGTYWVFDKDNPGPVVTIGLPF